VWLTVLHLQGKAQQWYMRLEQDEGTSGWRRFGELLDRRFGPPIRSNPLGELIFCRRSSSVEDYQERFLALLTCAGPLTESQKIQLFTADLQEPLSTDVQLQGPQSLELATSFARAYERCEQLTMDATSTAPFRSSRTPASCGLLPAPPAPAVLPAPVGLPALPASASSTAPPAPHRPTTSTTGTVTVAGRTVRHLSPVEIDECRCIDNASIATRGTSAVTIESAPSYSTSSSTSRTTTTRPLMGQQSSRASR
jgi:hypothetical protein